MLALVLAFTASGRPSAALEATAGGPLPGPLPLFPRSNWWNLDISQAPVDSNSAAFISFVGTTRQVHPDFGGVTEEDPVQIYGIPYIVVTDVQPSDLKA
ncbi:MAG TPA: hypothetical protein VFM29_01375, partial [Vicinamibacteria bacterium]|nr:hypothetical protein [Vicinamibacteria bacterium]